MNLGHSTIRFRRVVIATLVTGAGLCLPNTVYSQASRSAPEVPIQMIAAVSQVRQVTLDLRNVTLKKALDEVARQSGAQIAIGKDAILDTRKINVSIGPVSAVDAIHAVLKETGLVVQSSSTGQLMVTRPMAQDTAIKATGLVSGRVLDSATKRGLPNVTVTVRGTKLTTLTGEDGRYTLRDVPIGPRNIVARIVSHRSDSATVTITPKASAVADFILRSQATILSGVVTTATGEKRRSEVGNSITTLNVDSITRGAAVATVTDVLDGRVPGLIVSRSSGSPGAPSRIRIRGNGSVMASNDPIIILDGSRIYSAQTSSAEDAKYSVLDQIDLTSVEKIDVLKGPSASALYGSDAANGVIVITTKQGRPGKAQWTVQSNQQITTQPGNFTPLYYRLGTLQILGGSNAEHCILVGPARNASCVNDTLIIFNPLANPRTSVFGIGRDQSYNTSVSGGSQTLRYFFGGALSNTTGLLTMSNADAAWIQQTTGNKVQQSLRKPQQSSNVSGTSRISVQISPLLEVNITSATTQDKRQTTPMDQAIAAYQNQPTPDDTSLVMSRIGNFRQKTNTGSSTFRNQIDASWVPYSWSHLSANVGYQKLDRGEIALLKRGDCVDGPGCKGSGADRLGKFSEARNDRSVGSMDFRATFQLPQNRWIRLTPSLGANYSSESGANIDVKARDLALGATSSTGAGIINVDQRKSNAVQVGMYYGVGVSVLNDRLFTNFGSRIDASNALGKNITPTYPKLDLSYIISREQFFPVNLVSMLRLRLAYGHAAVQPEIGASLRTYNASQGVYSGIVEQTLQLATLGNNKLRPERTTEFETGFDIGILEDRITLGVTGYRKLSRDALVRTILPPSLTGGTLTSNIGSVKNSGLEMTIGAVLYESQLLRWGINIGTSRNRNTLVRLARESNRDLQSDLFFLMNIKDQALLNKFYGSRYVEGYPLDGVWVRPVIQYTDRNGDGLIEANEMLRSDSSVFVGGPLPNFEGVFGTQLGLWNGRITAGTSLQYQNGATQTNGTLLANMASAGNSTLRAFNDASTPIQEQVAVRSGNFAVRTVSTLRLTTLSVRAIVPKTISDRLRASNMSIALQANNLGLWTTYSGADPNVNASIVGNRTIDTGQLPLPRMWGLNIHLIY